MRMRNKPILFFYATTLLCVQATERLPVEITPSHAAIRYVGRFSEDFRVGWTGSKIEIDFKGVAVDAILELTEGDAAGITVVVDGKETFLKVQSNQRIYPIAAGLSPSQRHNIVLFKRSEGTLGEVRFRGFQFSDGSQVFKPNTPDRKILIIGDSITCGYGNEAATIEEGNTVENENGYLSYSAIAARELKADIMMICWSGIGLFRNHWEGSGTMPERFNRTLPLKETPLWNADRFIANVVIINLGANDMNTKKGERGPLEKAGYTSAYKDLLSRIRVFAPNSKIILSIGPKDSSEPVSNWLPEIAAEFTNTSVLVYTPPADHEGWGGDWHPSIKTHKKMAVELATEIRPATGW